MTRANDLVDLDRYPIDRPGHPLTRDVIARVQQDLAADGCALMPGFLSTAGLGAILAEAGERRHQAYFSEQPSTNAYFSQPDPALPANHPVNVMMPRTNGFITADLFGAETSARQLYHWPPLAAFLAACLGREQLYIYEDPVSNMIVNVGRPGSGFNWHFDTNEFTITMLLQPAESGGYFEYVPALRSADDECYDAVGEVLGGARERVRRLDLKPGDMQLFLGRFSLHQVTENTGSNDRLLIIMSFAEKPGMIGSKERVRQLYGKTTEAHENQRVRADGLRD